MANVNLCSVCGSEVFTGVDAGEAFSIGYCECVAVPEVDVYVIEENDMNSPCCVSTEKICIFCDVCGDFGTGPCSCDKNVIIEDEDFVYVYEEAEILAASVIGCSSCGQAACQGPNERGYCLEYYDDENEAALRKFQRLEDSPEPQIEKVRSFWEEAFLMLAILTSFFRLLYAIATGKVNDPSLVIAWYAFCGYLILSYTAVILWFVL